MARRRQVLGPGRTRDRRESGKARCGSGYGAHPCETGAEIGMQVQEGLKVQLKKWRRGEMRCHGPYYPGDEKRAPVEREFQEAKE